MTLTAATGSPTDARRRTGRQELRIAYLVSRYPKISHAFIETEVAALRDVGAQITTFSVRRAEPEELLSAEAREAARTTLVLVDRVVRTFLRAAVRLFLSRPAAILVALRLAMRSGPPTLRGRMWQLFYVGEAVILWWRMDRAGLRHVHVHFANNAADIARLAVALGAAVDGAGAGWRWSLTMHGPTEFEDQSGFDLPAKLVSASAVACISDFCRSQVMRHLPPSAWDKVDVVRMAVDASRFHPADALAAGPEDGGRSPLHVLTVGRLVPEKGTPVLVEAIARLRTAGVRVHLTVVGAGPLADELATQVRAAQLGDAVHLAGPLGQQALPDLYRRADVFCLPSFAEGLPVVLMEAMASGRPVVTTSIAGIPELVVDRRTGIVVAPGRPDLIADALAELAADAALGCRLGEAGRAAVLERHQPVDNAGRLLALWRSTDGQAQADPGLP